MKKLPIKIGQIGIGYWGPNLLRNLEENKKCEIKTVCDLNSSRRSFVKNLYPQVNLTANYEDIINDSEIDAVVISTPVSTHYELSIKSLKLGKHILVEKPMASSVLQVQEISNIAKKNDLVAMVGHTFLFNSAVRYVKKLIDSGDLGDIRYIYSQRLNLGRIRSDVDALWNLAPHDISIIQYWLDEPEPLSIKRIGKDYVQDDIDDVVFLNVSYPNNVMANIHVSWLDPQKVRKMTIVGSKKMVVYDDVSKDKVKIYDKGIDLMAVLGENMDFDDHRSFYYNHRSGEVTIPKIKWEEPLKNEISHFVSCIVSNEKCITDSFHAEKVVRILEDSQ